MTGDDPFFCSACGVILPADLDAGEREPDAFFRESMAPLKPEDEAMRPVRQKQAKWHSEMYGYVFAAASVGVTHRVRAPPRSPRSCSSRWGG